jgi:hypothetical protein
MLVAVESCASKAPAGLLDQQSQKPMPGGVVATRETSTASSGRAVFDAGRGHVRGATIDESLPFPKISPQTKYVTNPYMSLFINMA